MILGRSGDLNARSFSDVPSFVSHLRIVPADLVVVDHDLVSTTAPELLLSLRRKTSSSAFRSIVLTTELSRTVRQSCNFAQVDEVIVKPASPLFLNERARFWLAQSGVEFAPTDTDVRAFNIDTSADASNVIPLFSADPMQTMDPHPNH